MTTSSPVTFYIQSDSNINGINAYLASAPIAVGFKGSRQLALQDTAAAPGDNQILITLNNDALKVGSANAINVVDPATTVPSASACTRK
ncbi:hypothetical protein O0544_13980 [Edwardsiella anguillarum]|nr:hypothetical protein [Edwardsiella anguillarum]